MNVFLRALTVYTAVLTLSVANLWPVAVRAAEGVSAAVSESNCCCGTADGRCCGMACCGAPAHEGDPAPVPNGSAEWSAPAFLLHGDRPHCGQVDALARSMRSPADARPAVADESLRARHVLLQV